MLVSLTVFLRGHGDNLVEIFVRYSPPKAYLTPCGTCGVLALHRRVSRLHATQSSIRTPFALDALTNSRSCLGYRCLFLPLGVPSCPAWQVFLQGMRSLWSTIALATK